MFFFSAKREICYFADGNSLYFCGMNLDNIFTKLIQDTLQIGDVTTKSVLPVTLIGNNTLDSKLIRLISLFNDGKSIFLMFINLDVPLKSRYIQRVEKIQ